MVRQIRERRCVFCGEQATTTGQKLCGELPVKWQPIFNALVEEGKTPDEARDETYRRIVEQKRSEFEEKVKAL